MAANISAQSKANNRLRSKIEAKQGPNAGSSRVAMSSAEISGFQK